MEGVWAHSANDVKEKHNLIHHLLYTATLAESFARSCGIKDIVYAAALLHDLGKFHPNFQRYLDNPKMNSSVDHSSAGAVYASAFHPFGQVLAWLIAGHHAGLSDRSVLSTRLLKKGKDEVVQEAIKVSKPFIEEYFKPEMVPVAFEDRWRNCESRPEELEVWIRMLFSCLVDADFLNTESHFSCGQKGEIRYTWKASIVELWDVFEAKQESLLEKAEDTALNRGRRAVYEACITAAGGSQGLYTLSVPTGMGKTLSGMGFALRHALNNHQQRIIVVVPYTSIIDQNSSVYKDIFGKDFVLEHHSLVEPSVSAEQEERRKLAAENWDAPIVITTTVQFFESLFANRPSSTRKLHNICNSVVILDEFQMLPLELLQPIFSMMKQLIENYNVTFLLSSATPLALDLILSTTSETLPEAQSAVLQSEELFHHFQRVNYKLDSLDRTWTWDEVVDYAQQYRQALVIVNTKKQAKKLFDLFSGMKGVYHLSSNMCGKHRKDVLQEVKERLKKKQSVYLVSTQVVEAGVDLDFPLVMRALGPLDRIVQAAGRCNREGRIEKGTVIVFRPEEEMMPPGSYRTATYEAGILLAEAGEHLHSPGLYKRYFRRLYQSVDTDKMKIEELRRSVKSPLSFQEINKRFRMIPDDSISVICPYIEEVEEQVEVILQGQPLTREWIRNIQPYTVNLLKRMAESNEVRDNLELLCEGWYVWRGEYSMKTGIKEGMDYDPQYLST